MVETADLRRKGRGTLRVVGIDPGMALLGYGIVTDADTPRALAYGVVSTAAHLRPEQRLVSLYEELLRILQQWQPEVVALEQLFFARNVTTALAVGQARGVVLLLCGQLGIPVVEYTPAQVKQAIGGYGRAGKRQMQEMVRLLLQLPEIPQPDDAADALAIAICHLHHLRSPWIEESHEHAPDAS